MKAFAKTGGVLAALMLILIGGAAASAQAAELIAFVSARCPYCVAWEREVGRTYAKTQEAREAPLRRVDADARSPASPDGIEAVKFTPTFVLIDGEREVGRISGYSGAGFFWAQLDKLLATLHAEPPANRT